MNNSVNTFSRYSTQLWLWVQPSNWQLYTNKSHICTQNKPTETLPPDTIQYLPIPRNKLKWAIAFALSRTWRRFLSKQKVAKCESQMWLVSLKSDGNRACGILIIGKVASGGLGAEMGRNISNLFRDVSWEGRKRNPQSSNIFVLCH